MNTRWLGGTLFSAALVLAASDGCKRSQTRSDAIEAGIAQIGNECRRDAGGDWTAWFNKLAPFRADLIGQIRAAQPFNPTSEASSLARWPVIELKGEPPLFEAYPEHEIAYLFLPTDLDDWIRSCAVIPTVIAVSRWLGKRGIDLIFVPVPKMSEVYPDRLSDSVPKSRVVAPQMRKTIQELLIADVEVVDLLPLYLEARLHSDALLFQAADPHWSQRGAEIAAQELARRLSRYVEVKRTLREPPGYQTTNKEAYVPGAAYEALNPDQKRRVQQALHVTEATVLPRSKPLTSMDSPVVLIGDSYNFALYPLLAKHLNMPVTTMIAGGQTTESIKEFARDGSLLKGRRVVIWLVSAIEIPKTAAWKLPSLP